VELPGVVAGPQAVAGYGVSGHADEAAGFPHPHAFGDVLQEGDDLVLGQAGVEQGGPFALREAVLAGAAAQAPALLGPVAHADGQVAVAAFAVVGALPVLAAEAAQVVVGWPSLAHGSTSGATRLAHSRLGEYNNAGRAILRSHHRMKRGVNIHFVNYQIDTTTPHGKLQFGMTALFAEFERNMISERTREVMRAKNVLEKVMATKRRRGIFNGKAPYGYKLAGRTRHRRKIPDPDERKYVEFIAELIDDRGMTFDEVYSHFLKAGIRTRKDKEWTRSRILRSYVFYKAGKLDWGPYRVPVAPAPAPPAEPAPPGGQTGSFC
jgi:hypothetical protein